MITLKVTKNQGFTLSSLEDTLFEKPQLLGEGSGGGGGQIKANKCESKQN